MSSGPPRDAGDSPENPYAPPMADPRQNPPGEFGDSEAAAVRRELIGREKAIKRIAWINLILAIIWLPACITLLFSLLLVSLASLGFDLGQVREPPVDERGWELVGLALFHTSFFSLFVALFSGLRRLRSWARWTTVVLILTLPVLFIATYAILHSPPRWLLFPLAAFVISVVVAVYILVSPPSGRVFSREYRQVIAQTGGRRFGRS
jgi:hypothetical protein